MTTRGRAGYENDGASGTAVDFVAGVTLGQLVGTMARRTIAGFSRACKSVVHSVVSQRR